MGLSPEIETIRALIFASFHQMLKLDNFSLTGESIVLGHLPSDPPWLPPVRQELEVLCKKGGNWFKDKPEIWSEIAETFEEYSAAFSSVYEQSPTTRCEWKDALEFAHGEANKALSRTQHASNLLDTHLNELASLKDPIAKSILQGWIALDHEEAAMTEIAEQMGKLENAIGDLQEKIDETTMDGGKDVTENEVEQIYSIIEEGKVSISYLSLAGSFYSIGDSFYNLITTSQETSSLAAKLEKLQKNASEEAQAAAGTKAVLRLLYKLLQGIGELANLVPQLCRMWQAEIEKLEIALAAIKSGADCKPFARSLDLKGSAETWNTLKSITRWTIDTTMNHRVGPRIVIPKPM